MTDTKSERDKRLAAALRENLKRRKARARDPERKTSDSENPG